jgi:hypothetical protein
MDYWVEKETPYNIRDQFLGIPYANTDMFTVMGEGLGGTFRPYSKYAGYFRPDKKESQTDMYDIGIDIMLGMDNGGGGRMGFLGMIENAKAVISSDPSEVSIPIKSGANILTLQGWDDCDHAYGSTEDESIYMSFIGDPGGSGDFNNEDAQAAILTSTGSKIAGFKADRWKMAFSHFPPASFDLCNTGDKATCIDKLRPLRNKNLATFGIGASQLID